jgi:hypothetical protein
LKIKVSETKEAAAAGKAASSGLRLENEQSFKRFGRI